ncbi:hypothetical protein IFO69_13340 [Echinicola sp. CAU 1574]|uniref:Uncharacterized protein n=1 Tax=Echinicola arenosa TaxID=2774144 RepID=A0ABR9ALP1_9BACT|nr:hypothetical protein [Echinicola arenosa]MBD8489735.1 hypothetical protein [Echinicola arenosa]
MDTHTHLFEKNKEELINLISRILELDFDKVLNLKQLKRGTQSYSSDEIKLIVKDFISTIESISSHKDKVEFLSYEDLKSLNMSLKRFSNNYQKTILNEANPEISNVFGAFDAIREINSIIRSTGLYNFIYPSGNIIDYEGKLDQLIASSEDILNQATLNAKTIRNLIPEAAASSLSNTISDRAELIKGNVNKWLIGTIVSVIVFFLVSLVFLYGNGDDDSIEWWIKKIITLSPLIYILIFCLKQYNRERKLLEIYEHKKSISQALPAYIEQAQTEESKNEILLRGSSMIFTLPENPETPVQGSDGLDLGEIEKIAKIIKS